VNVHPADRARRGIPRQLARPVPSTSRLGPPGPASAILGAVRRAPDDELLSLVAETNDLRRVVGQALWLLRSILLQSGPAPARFPDGVRRWASSVATALGRMEARLRRAGPEGADGALRAFLGALLQRLGEDLVEGERLRLAFVRTLEMRMAELSRLLREEGAPRKVFDVGLAQDAAAAWGILARARPADLGPSCLQAARRLADPS